ncbi:MAG TPA: FAD:protein FMN transferase [Cellvibrio sp.]|nr:FAD:protein FMN transferase [Cellvibrio sp.]
MKCLTLPTLAFILTGLLACSRAPELAHIEGFAQGTTYHISFTPTSPDQQATISGEITAEFARLDQAISNYRPDSMIEMFNAQLSSEPQQVTEEIVYLIEIARAVSSASHGCYDLTVKPLFDLWGFKKDSFNLPDDQALQQARALVDMNKLETLDKNHIRKALPELRVDLSSIGQGYSVGRIAAILEAHAIENYLVEIGGELKVRGKKSDDSPWRVALEKPLPNQRKLDKIVVFNSGEPLSLMASGTYRHYFDNNGKRYSHILDARTGKPVEHNTVAATVLHPDPAVADAWSTALLCLGSEEGMRVANANAIAALYIDQDGDALLEKKTSALADLKNVSFAKPD